MQKPTMLQELFADVSKAFLARSHATKAQPVQTPEQRAASVMEIWDFVRAQLEAEWALENPGATTQMDEYGNEWSLCPSYVLDVYLNDKGAFALVTKSDGKLYKIPVTVGKDNAITLDTPVEVFMEALPVQGRQFSVKRQADGRVRWFAMPACTAVLNRSGEIDSRALFDSFVEHIMRTDDYPVMDFYHLGEAMPIGKADWVGRDGVAYCASGLFDETPLGRAAVTSLEKNPEYWGLSIAYLPTSDPTMIRSSDGVSIPVYNSGINCFISLLPEQDAASILTSIRSTKEVNRMNPKIQVALDVLTNGDKSLLDELQMKLDSINRSAAGMISRDANLGLVTGVPVMQAPATPAVEVELAPAVEERAFTAEDLTAMLADPAFEARVIEIIKAQNVLDAQAELDAATANATMQENQRKEIATLRTAIGLVSTELKQFKTASDAKAQTILDDMPANNRQRQGVILRPRATIPPAALNASTINMAAVAEETLAKMG